MCTAKIAWKRAVPRAVTGVFVLIITNLSNGVYYLFITNTVFCFVCTAKIAWKRAVTGVFVLIITYLSNVIYIYI